MNYPLISEYIEAIKAAEDNFEELTNLRPVLGDDGQPVMTSGNFAVVFKMEDSKTGKFYALKCFTKEQEGRAEAYHQIADALKDVDSPYLISIQYLDRELFVDTDQTTETEFPVLLMDWVEGKTLDKYLRENLDDKYALEMLAYRFSQLAQWLIPQPFAHGDLKPDNILVREDGSLVLVDYDGMYVPAMKGQKARELGSPDFRHPQRTENDFNEHIDDFPLVMILLSLKAISLNPQLLEEYGAVDRLLFSENDCIQKFNCLAFKAVQRLDYNNEIGNLIYMALSFLSSFYIENYGDLKHCLNLYEPTPSNNDWSYLQTACGRTNVSEGIKDEYGTIYSKSGERLLKGAWGNFGSYYSVKPETRIICNNAFDGCLVLKYIDIPQSVEKIGAFAFNYCRELQFLKIPEGLDILRTGLFNQCSSLFGVFIPDSVKAIHGETFQGCVSLQSIVFPIEVMSIGNYAFSGCKSLKEIDIPNSVTSIGEWAFEGCEKLKRVTLSNGISKIENGCFSGCYELEDIFIPSGVRSIDDKAFEDCKKLKIVYLPDSVVEIGEEPFIGCESLMFIVVPKGTKWMFENLLPNDKDKIKEMDSEEQDIRTEVSKVDLNNVWIDEYGVIYSSDRTRLLKAPTEPIKRGNHNWTKSVLSGTYSVRPGTQYICDKAFLNCCDLSAIILPLSVKQIGSRSFQGCLNLCTVELNDSLIIIGDNAFRDCKKLHSIHLPESLEQIGNNAFYGCRINVIFST
jgi:serine/threonine protein kinase